MKTKIISTIILLCCLSSISRSQNITSIHLNDRKVKHDFLNDKVMEDTNTNQLGKKNVEKVNIGGLFISPTIGVSFPLGNFANYSDAGLLYGVKLELAFIRLYPFVFGFVYEYQKNPGSGDFTAANLLTQFDTKISSFGGSMDIILNKYLKSNFTIPIFSIEVKYANVSRDIAPVSTVEGIINNESLLTFSGGLGFTIYVIDISGKYTYAQNFSSITFQTRFHFPIFRF